MSKKIVENLITNLPWVIKNIAKLLKENFDESGKSLLEKSTGLAAIIIKLFAQPSIDKYFDGLTEKKVGELWLKNLFKSWVYAGE
jgi:hypothetical protein